MREREVKGSRRSSEKEVKKWTNAEGEPNPEKERESKEHLEWGEGSPRRLIGVSRVI